jgi:hypothetical protein
MGRVSEQAPDALALAARLAREIAEREAVMLECLETALEQGCSVLDMAEVTGIPRSTLQRRLSRPGAFAGRVSDPALAAELDAMRRARLERARTEVGAAEVRLDALPAMLAEIEEANGIAMGLVDVE